MPLTTKTPSPVKFFLDRNIARRFAPVLRIMTGQPHDSLERIVHMWEKFENEEELDDVDWIPVLGDEGNWVIVSGDPQITRSKAERAAWAESGLTGFFLSDWARRQRWKQAAHLMKWWPEIERETREGSPGRGFLIPWLGSTWKQIYPH